MFKNRRLIIISIIMFTVFGVVFNIGVFQNPNFSIYDFCGNLATEIVGMVIALIVVEAYIREREKARSQNSGKNKEDG